METRIRKNFLVFIVIILVLPAFVNASYFTLPVDVPIPDSITSYFDHDHPDFSITGEIYLYDGTYASSTYGVCEGRIYNSAPGGGGDCISYDGHNGIDFATSTGAIIQAPYEGEVKNVYWNDLGGWTVHVYHDEIGLSTLYGHVGTTTIATTTDVVERYDPIAYVNSTGASSTGPHLHFGVVDDEELSGNRIDPFGWSATTTDPWQYNQGYLWTTNPPSLDLNLTNNLVSVWLSDDSGLTTDLHGSNDLTDNNTVTFLDDGGKNGDAGDFEASNSEWLSISDASQSGLDISGDFSISAWINLETIDFVAITSKYFNSGSATKRSYYFDIKGTGDLGLRLSDNGSNHTGHHVAYQTDDSEITSTGVWYHVVSTYDISTEEAIFYINGSSVASSQPGGTTLGASLFNTSEDFRIGALRGGSGIIASFFDGVMHQVAVWNRALSASEVSALYNSGNGISFDDF